MIIVHSTFHLRSESLTEALDLMRNMARLCRHEHGCLSYDYFQGLSDPNQVILLQEWENADCLKGHYQTDHMEDFIARLGAHLQSPVSTRSYVSRDEVTGGSRDGAKSKPTQTIH